MAPRPAGAMARLEPLLRRLRRHFGGADISYAQWDALRCLDQHGTACTRMLAAELAMTQCSARRIAAGLEARGLVECEVLDPRAVGLRPTPAGLAKLREVAPEIDQRLAEALVSLTDSEAETLTRLLGRVSDCLDRSAEK